MYATKHTIAFFEIITLILLYYLVTWQIIPSITTQFHANVLFGSTLLVGVYFVYFSPVRIHGDHPHTRGIGETRQLYIRTDNLSVAFKPYLGFVLTATAILLIATVFKDVNLLSSFHTETFISKFILYLFSAALQDIIFFSFLFVRIVVLIAVIFKEQTEQFRKVLSVAVFTLLFSLFHLPNTELMGITVFFSFWLGWIFYEHPNLFLIVITHALLGTMLHRIYQLHMKLGVYYGTYGEGDHFFRNYIPILQHLIENRW